MPVTFCVKCVLGSSVKEKRGKWKQEGKNLSEKGKLGNLQGLKKHALSRE